MAITQERYIPAEWFNQTFLLLENVSIFSRPSNTGFLHPTYTFGKRLGVETKTNPATGTSLRQADGTIVGEAKFDGKIFVYSDAGSVYTFDGNDLTLIKKGLYYDDTIKDDPFVIRYVGGARYPDASTSFTVSSYNTTTFELVVTTTNITNDFIGKYIYIQTGSAAYQFAQITGISGNDTLIVGGEAGGTVLNTPVSNGDTFFVFDNISQQIVFPSLRIGQNSPDRDFCFAVDDGGNKHQRYINNLSQATVYDTRLAKVWPNKTSVLLSQSGFLETIDIANVFEFRSGDILNIAAYDNALLIFFQNKVGYIRKIFNEINGNTTISFVYEDLIDTWPYSADSFLIKGSEFYYFANNNTCYSVKITGLSTGQLTAELVDIGQTMISFFQAISGGEVSRSFLGDDLYMRHLTGQDLVVEYVYNSNFRGWTINRYELGGRFAKNKFRLGGQSVYTVSGSDVVRFAGLKDLDNDFEQKITVYWPVQTPMNFATLLFVKARIGFDGQEQIGGKAKITIGGRYKYVMEKDLKDLELVQEINEWSGDAAGTIGSSVFGTVLYGGEPWFWTAGDYFNEFHDIQIRVGKAGSYFTVEFTNDEQKQMYIAGIETIFNLHDPRMIYNKNNL